MEKRDYIWVAIRIFGIYLLVQAVMVFPTMVSALFQATYYWGGPQVNDGIDLDRLQYASAMATLLRSGLGVLIYAIVGIYLTFGGKLVFRRVYPPDEPKT